MKVSEEKYYTCTLNMVVLNVIAVLMAVVIFGFIYLIGYELGDITFDIILLVIVWFMLHELLHGIGFACFKSVDKRNIVFGMALEKGIFYCMCKQKISRKVIFTSLLFPVTIIGLITLVLGIVINDNILVYLSIFNIIGSVGDILMIIFFMKCPEDIKYIDLDDCTSFTIISKKDIGNIRVPGIRVIDNGIVEGELFAIDNRRIVVSRLSLVFIIFLFIVVLIKLIGGIL